MAHRPDHQRDGAQRHRGRPRPAALILKPMKALWLEAAVGPAGGRVADLDCPEPAAGEVRVRLRAAALNHRELWIERGQYPGMRLPCTMGCDGAGVIDTLGQG